MRLDGKVALVTGGARGIGAGIVRCLAAEGASVGIVDLDLADAEETAANLGANALAFEADVSQAAEIVTATERAVRAFGGLDILVNNAGATTGREEVLPSGGPGFEHQTQEGWDSQVTNNLRTTFAASKAGIPHLKTRGGGSIVNIASIAGLTPTPAVPAYGAAKAGVIHLTRTLALELAPHQIRVNAICPGYLWTRAWERIATLIKLNRPELEETELRDIFLAVVKHRVPLGREQTPEDIGKLTLFLASDDARNITGQEITVDGGITLRTGV
jgi:NAD(P)-dependent dehydrogenase (short-subunit alcohol dehydrogenase family)